VRTLSHEQIHALPAVQQAFADASNQLQRYQPPLAQQYGEVLRLQMTAVVALGFERIVWQTIATAPAAL